MSGTICANLTESVVVAGPGLSNIFLLTLFTISEDFILNSLLDTPSVLGKIRSLSLLILLELSSPWTR